MKKLTIIFVLLFLVIIFLVPNVSAFNGPRQVITGKFEAGEAPGGFPMPGMPADLIVQVSIVGSANISPSGSLETSNIIPEADQNVINDTFTSFAESLNCTVGNAVTSDDPMFMGRTAISFVCEGTHRDVLDKTTNLLRFPLTFEANAGPIN